MEPDFPCLADEIAEPRPDMNIKIAAFTVSEKSINSEACRDIFHRINKIRTGHHMVKFWTEFS